MKGKIIKQLLFLLVILFFGASSSQAQVHRYHSLFLYNFTKYIQWPANYQQGDFVIGVLGDSPIQEHLENIADNKTAGSQKFVIKKFDSPEQVTQCHMLYLPDSESKHIDDLKAKLQGKSTLIITERNGMAEKGSNINFILVDGKVKFEMNKKETDDANLKVSTELSRLAIII